MWSWVQAVELAIALAGSVAFCVALWRQRRWRSSPEGRQLMITFGYWGTLILARLLAFAVPVPGWVFAIVWAPFGLVIWRWVWLVRRSPVPVIETGG